MTSEKTKKATLEFLAKNKFFGLPENDVVVFEQVRLSTLFLAIFGKKILFQGPDTFIHFRWENHSGGQAQNRQKSGWKWRPLPGSSRTTNT